MGEPAIGTRKWTRLEYDRLVEAEILGPEDRIELLGGQMIVKEPQYSPHATAIQLTVVTDAVVAAARRASGANVAVSGNTITIEVGKPERDNPGLVKAVVAAGGEIQFVSGTVPTLEETYLRLLARDYEHSEKSRPTDQPAPARQ